LSQELAALKPGESVYKLMGPMLVRQEQADARAVVDGRLEFLEKEL
jgi:prefoldin beta subunit